MPVPFVENPQVGDLIVAYCLDLDYTDDFKCHPLLILDTDVISDRHVKLKLINTHSGCMFELFMCIIENKLRRFSCIARAQRRAD